MKNVTETIFEMGEILYAKRLEVVSFRLGPVELLKPYADLIEKDGENVILHKQIGSEEKAIYSNGYIAVLDLIEQEWYLKAIPYDIANKKFASSVSKGKLISRREEENLRPIFMCAGNSVVRGVVIPERTERVIIITKEMAVPNTIPGEIFIIEDKEKQTGTYMDRLEFERTHAFLPY